MKHLLALTTILSLTVAMLSSCQGNVTNVTGVSLNAAAMNLKIGTASQLVATVSPNNADNKVVLWSTSNSSIATVDANGWVTGVDVGDAVITAKTDDGGMTSDCYVTVELGITLSLDKSIITLRQGDKMQLSATMVPHNDGYPVEWSSSDTSVASVENGLVSANGAGTATITASVKNVSASCEVSVQNVNKLIKTIEMSVEDENGTSSGTLCMSYDNLNRLRCLEIEADKEHSYKALVDYQADGKAYLIDISSQKYNTSVCKLRRVLALTFDDNGHIAKGLNTFYSPFGVSYLYDSQAKMISKTESYFYCDYKGHSYDVTSKVSCTYKDNCLAAITISSPYYDGNDTACCYYGDEPDYCNVSVMETSLFLQAATSEDFMAGDIAMNMINEFPGNSKLLDYMLYGENQMIKCKYTKNQTDGTITGIFLGESDDDGALYKYSYVNPGSQTYEYIGSSAKFRVSLSEDCA